MNTGEPLRLDTGRTLGRIHRQGIISGILGGIPLASYSGNSAEYSAGPTGGLLWWDTWRDPLVHHSGGILSGIQWRATQQLLWDNYSAGYSAGSALMGCSAGFTGKLLWWDTWRDPLASHSGGILSGIQWRATLARRDPLAVGYSAGSAGEPL